MREHGLPKVIYQGLNNAGAAGKKNRLKERRLMKGFNLSTSGLGSSMAGAPASNPDQVGYGAAHGVGPTPITSIGLL